MSGLSEKVPRGRLKTFRAALIIGDYECETHKKTLQNCPEMIKWLY